MKRPIDAVAPGGPGRYRPWDGDGDGDGIITVAGVTFLDIARGFFAGQDAKQFLFFTRRSMGIEAGNRTAD